MIGDAGSARRLDKNAIILDNGGCGSLASALTGKGPIMYRSITPLLVVIALALGASASAAPPPLPPQAAEIAREAGKAPLPLSVRPATPAEVARAFARPGADSEGTPPGRTLARRAAADAISCWFAEPSYTWESWSPWKRTVTQHTYWCGYWAGAITARTTWTTADSWLCSHDSYNFKLGGGIGYSWVYVESGGNFSCPTSIPWVTCTCATGCASTTSPKAPPGSSTGVRANAQPDHHHQLDPARARRLAPAGEAAVAGRF
jgi:hypothetical protein